MKKTILMIIILALITTGTFANDFKKRRDIINSILKEQNDNMNKKNSSKIIPRDTDEKKENTDNDDKKSFNPHTSDEILLKTGINFYHSGMYSHSLIKFKELIKDHPKSMYVDSTRIWIGKTLLKQYKYTDANKELSLIKPDSGEYPTALYHMASSYQLQRNYKMAIELFQKIAGQFPQHELADNALLNSGIIQLNNRNGIQAMESVISIIKFYNDRETIDDAYFLLGQIFERDEKLKDMETARRVYKTFLKKVQDGQPFFKNSPLTNKVKRDLRNLERNFFRYE